MRVFDPKAIAEPGPTYHHGVEIPAGARTLFISGQIGVKKDGSVPATIEEQSEVVWQNIQAILADAGMSTADLVKINSYVTKAENFPKYSAVRGKFLNGVRPASTSVIITALVRPDLLVEVEAVAAKV